jgi:vacuolar-type H+-ATPase subunit I/STV1
MSTHKTVYNKLFSKQELSAEKVELALVDAFEKKFKSLIDDSTSIGSQLIDALSKAENKYKQVKSEASALVKIGDDLEAKAKDLGIDLPNTVKNKFESVKAEIKEADKLIAKISQLYSAF